MGYRTIVVLAFALLGCTKGEKGDPGEQGPQGPQGATGMMGAAGRDGVTPKSLHLVVVSTGEDLGPFTGGACAFDAQESAELCYSDSPVVIYFDAKGCAGTAHSLRTNLLSSQRLRGPSTYWRPSGVVSKEVLITESILGSDGVCVDSQQQNTLSVPISDTGTNLRTYPLIDLAIALR